MGNNQEKPWKWESDRKPIYKEWIQRDFWIHRTKNWHSSDAVLLSCDIDPDKAHIVDRGDILEFSDIAGQHKYDVSFIEEEAQRKHKLIYNALASGKLEYMNVCKPDFQDPESEYLIDPRKCLILLEGKGELLPEGFTEFIVPSQDIVINEVSEVLQKEEKKGYEDFIRKTKIVLSANDRTQVQINPSGKQFITRSKYDLGFSERAKNIWPTFKTVLENGYISLGINPRNKEKIKAGTDINRYERLYKHLTRISKKLISFFNKEWKLDIPNNFFFFEPYKNSSDKGIFKPIFITEKETKGLQVIQVLKKKNIPLKSFIDKINDIDNDVE